SAVLRFRDTSRVLLHDGKGTDVLYETQIALLQLVLPPPAGPSVSSPTHPDQDAWYASNVVTFQWPQDSTVDGYSYMLSAIPVDIPDAISQGVQTGVTYRDLADGRYYFHISALRGGVWGGTTHVAALVDTAPPAAFPLQVNPAKRTSERTPVLNFDTTDAHSGVSHYGLKLVPLRPVAQAQEAVPFFIEVQSPYISPSLELGKYDAIVRAYDRAGNIREVIERVHIVTPVLGFLYLPYLWAGMGVIIVLLAVAVFAVRRLHAALDRKASAKEFPTHIRQQLQELQEYRKKYGKTLALLFILGVSLFASPVAWAQQNAELAPPVVTSASRTITNEDIFYIGGRAQNPGARIIVYLQNLLTGETRTVEVEVDNRGDWFYRHVTFLSAGDYMLWAQSTMGEQQSPPSPQIQMEVRGTALQIGTSRISSENLYLGISALLLFILVGLSAYVVVHAKGVRKKHRALQKEIREAEESIRRGFAVLKRDIEAELALVRRAKLSKRLSTEEQKQEEQLLRDLAWAEQYIGKEVWDVAEKEHED
ncbi:MAG: hypothetical protein AAB538_04835, partial [Patescibacteria group bacterium]